MIRLIVYSIAVVCIVLLLQMYLITREEARQLAMLEPASKEIPRPPVSKLYNQANLPLQQHGEYPRALPGLFLPCSRGIPVSHLKAFAVGDIDNDGKNEIIISEGADAKESKIFIIKRSSSGRFQRSSRFLLIEGDIRSLAVGDINGDGKNELVAVDFLKSSLTVYVADASGDFATGPSYSLPDPRQIMLGYFNNDRRIDVLLYRRVSANKIASVILHQKPDGLLGSADKEFITYVGPEESIRGVTTADLESKGNKELIVTHGGKKGASVTATSLTPPYSSRILFSLSDDHWAGAIPIAASYIDGDGRSDLIVYKDGIYAYLQKNDGTFSPLNLVCGLERDTSVVNDGIAVGDMDGNGTEDVIIATHQSRGDSINILCRVPIAP